MRKKTKISLALGLLGVALALVSLALEGRISDPIGGMLMGIGAGLVGFGFSQWRMWRGEEKDPQKMRQSQVEANDERNVAIRRRAQAVSGEVLQWTVMAATLISIGLEAPLWVTLAGVSVFLAKCILELVLMLRYQRQM